MSTLQSEIESSVTDFLHSTATQYGEAVTEYGNAFIAYGKGEIGAAKVAETTLKLAANGALRVVKGGVNLGTSYAKWVASLVGVKVVKEEVKIGPVPSAPTIKTRKTSR
jgi:hypothetical protein